MIWIWLLAVLCSLALLYLLYQKRQEEEAGLFYKLLGFSFLGAFRLHLNDWHLPVGLVVGLLLLAKVKRNKGIKQLALVFGFMLFLIQMVTPVMQNAWFEQPRSVATSFENWYSQELGQVWIDLEERMELQHSHLESFELVYEADGRLEQLQFTVIQQRQNDIIYTSIDLDKQQKQFIVKQQRIVGPWLQFEHSIAVQSFFEKLDTFNKARIRPMKSYPYYKLLANGDGWVNYGIKQSEKYVVDEMTVTELTNDQLPVTGFWLVTRGLEDKDDLGGEQADFLFDYRFEVKNEQQ